LPRVIIGSWLRTGKNHHGLLQGRVVADKVGDGTHLD